ncbi:NUDIX hydrolase [Radiobacillus sp. PE A8.2]|uniref:NUDIX hydrolase n=1 Tax=Radiobacillus sp. PE A8.2 TaxID=3380349 RepID=UPI00388FF539
MIGNAPLFVPACLITVYNSEDQLLLQLHSDTNDWGLPGGQIDLGETPIACAKRELYEETGLTAHTLELVDVFAGEELFFEYPNGDQTYGLCIVYRTSDYEGVIQIDQESHTLQFFDVDDLPEKIFSAHRFIFESLFSKE